MTINITENAKILINEILDNGITTDTMASERLYRFYMSLQHEGTEREKEMGKMIEQLDKFGATRTKAITYALLVIGSTIGLDIFKYTNI